MVLVGVVACEQQTPTGVDEEVLPGEPVTLEIEFGWDEFASNLQVLGGYGSPQELGTGVAASKFAGALDARTLVRFSSYPGGVSVRDTTGTVRQDSTLAFVSGRVVAIFDTIASTNEGPVELAIGALQHDWDAGTVTWTTAVDTINDRRSWPEEGAGEVIALGTSTWDPATGDSVWFDVDSAQIAAWADTTDQSRGVRIDVITEGERLQIRDVKLRLNTRPGSNPDTILILQSLREDITFVYSPFPEPPPAGIRVGGAPAWRTVLDVEIPTVLNGPAELCAVVQCPVTITPAQVNYAALVLTSTTTELAFQPTDTIGLDVRPVLLRSALPKAPLGGSLIGLLGARVGPSAFGPAGSQEVEIPFTSFAQALVQGEGTDGIAPPNTLALLSIFEPVSITFGSFNGPGPLEPRLKMIVTVGAKVDLP